MRHLDSASLFFFFIPPGGFVFPAVVWYILSGRATGRRSMMYIPRKNCKTNGNTFLPLCRVMPSWASAEEKKHRANLTGFCRICKPLTDRQVTCLCEKVLGCIANRPQQARKEAPLGTQSGVSKNPGNGLSRFRCMFSVLGKLL